VYLAEYKHQDANITNLDDAFWWAIVTITTVGYGKFFPLTFVGRAIGVLVMFSGIGRCSHSRYHFTEKNQGFRINVKIKD
jgi:voltage-gated potassium channel Kch